ncbi:3-deoxy-D-manno-octulosonic acid transferase [Paenirhodobacter sp.]|uniref:3-deoxy-D-manno-octulosonic acid transferase n=1 Tax=Paenirhodobacter sp. TaxID=1965326 RepID=UPI003B3E1BE9
MLRRLRHALSPPRRPGPATQEAITQPRPDGPLIWFVIDPAPEMESGVAVLLRRLRQQQQGLTLLVSAPEAMAMALPPRTIRLDPPEDSPAAARALIGHWQPDLIVLMGGVLPAALIDSADEAGIVLMAVDSRLPEDAAKGFFRRRLTRQLLAKLVRISARDAQGRAALIALGVDPERVEVGGVLSEPAEPLHCSEAERSSIAAITRTRPVWLAAAVPADEIALVLEAHTHAARHAHRMLLILAPDDETLAEALVQRLDSEGWVVGQRTVEGEPDTDMQIFIADDPQEYGLWYRIAPVSYMGGTLTGSARFPRSPLEPAALGSAVVHGPQTAPFGPDYARLDEARAARAVDEDHHLASAIADLMAPDRAAMLAHNAWAITSGGAGAAEAVAQAILAELGLAELGLSELGAR